ncbi:MULTISPECIES: hypothetical protein [Staphylococcus]|nr:MULTISPECIES: hypothetical protein [Staphylococcus]MDU5817624.1 hypothetical protein [Staphylococcus sp.]MDU6806474.1 hypothetical protein [Staphylococcus epidermidis]MBF2287738.1 hypothetical protein [Staphylococcus haemolyticus]MCC3656466.1 hypothetical protein [Staphylococcus haemolyticus]MCH4316955.1 hypothetical protein [Staphylococcus haemolyticus]
MEYKLAEKSYVTVSDLFEYVEKEVELMEYSKKQKRQFNQRRHETNT